MRFNATWLLRCTLLIPLALAFLPRLSAFAIVSLPYRDSSGESHHMPGLLQRLLPREEGFFDLFVQQAENILLGHAGILRKHFQQSGRSGMDVLGLLHEQVKKALFARQEALQKSWHVMTLP